MNYFDRYEIIGLCAFHVTVTYAYHGRTMTEGVELMTINKQAADLAADMPSQ